MTGLLSLPTEILHGILSIVHDINSERPAGARVFTKWYPAAFRSEPPRLGLTLVLTACLRLYDVGLVIHYANPIILGYMSLSQFIFSMQAQPELSRLVKSLTIDYGYPYDSLGQRICQEWHRMDLPVLPNCSSLEVAAYLSDFTRRRKEQIILPMTVAAKWANRCPQLKHSCIKGSSANMKIYKRPVVSFPNTLESISLRFTDFNPDFASMLPKGIRYLKLSGETHEYLSSIELFLRRAPFRDSVTRLDMHKATVHSTVNVLNDLPDIFPQLTYLWCRPLGNATAYAHASLVDLEVEMGDFFLHFMPHLVQALREDKMPKLERLACNISSIHAPTRMQEELAVEQCGLEGLCCSKGVTFTLNTPQKR